MKIERINGLTESGFLNDYVKTGRPVIVTDATNNWDFNRFTPSALKRQFGNEYVQIYDNLFALQKIDTLRSYLDTFFDRSEDQGPCDKYVRWFTRLQDMDFVWADEAFKKLSDAWQLPYFFRDHSMILPYCSLANNTSNVHYFPFKGLFISARGAKTRLHRDPLNSNALLCQVYGKKKFVLYSPDQADFLMHGETFVDINNPDPKKFPAFNKAKPTYEDILSAGEIVLFPKGWFHDVTSIEDSVSITWNFVYAIEREEFCSYLRKYPQESQLDTARFFLKNWLPKNAGASDIIDFVKQNCPGD